VRPVLAAAALALLAFARPAHAGAALGVGADWLTEPRAGEFQLTVAADTALARRLTLGARFGMMYFGDGQYVGAPIDLRLRVRTGRLYAEGLAGTWIVFGGTDTVRLHGAFGFGLYSRSLTFGFEVGWVDPTPLVGVRIAFPL
jgi:hypothetical protein